MSIPSEKELAGLLVGIISDGFNRSLRALAEAGAVDTKKLHTQYKGVGSKYYDLVTAQIELTAKNGAAGIRKHWAADSALKKES
jgi:hypothetical protein